MLSMIAKLIDSEHPLLHRKLKKVNKIDDSLKKNLQDMQDTLDFTGGVGIAANQIGLDMSVFLVDPQIEKQALKLKKPRKFAAYFNPVLKEQSKEKAYLEEGCLSLPGYRGEVFRHKSVTLEYMDFDGNRKTLEATGLLAHIFQHETDHLEGYLYIDKIEDKKKRLYSIKPLKMVFFGSSEFSVPVLEKLISMKYSWEYYVTGIVTLPDRPSQRGLAEKATHVSELASEYKIPVIKPAKLKDQSTIDQIKAWEPDIIILASYRKIIPQVLLDIPRFGWLNVHPSLLPLYRGPSPIQSAIIDGLDETGITIMKMNARLDEGEIVSQAPFSILPEDTYASLREKMAYQSGLLLAYTLPSYIDGKIELLPQEPLVQKLIKSKVITTTEDLYTQMFTKESGYIDLENPPSKELLNQLIRGLYPWPGQRSVPMAWRMD
jgi:methionyl-tRNA formyltransferase